MARGSKSKGNKAAAARTSNQPTSTKDLNEYEGEEYVVEKILDKKVTTGKDGGVFYLIKWQGYPIEESTWEPEENCLSSKDIIRKFEQAEQKKKGGKRSSGSSEQVIPPKDVHAESIDGSVSGESISAKRGRISTPISKEQVEEGHAEAIKSIVQNEMVKPDDEAVDSNGTTDVPAKAKTDSDAVSKQPLSPGNEEGSSDDVHMNVFVPDVMSEGNDEDALTAGDQLLRVCQGVKIRSVMGVSNCNGTEELKALVRYEDEKYEMVPTRVLHLMAPKPLLKYYESNLRFRSQKS